uniref:Uridine 5'-monophosphate synthase n=1 Tax=Strigamia maritima TaxID=126957 RepID=T1JH20_STRMM
MNGAVNALVLSLFEKKVFKFGKFMLKSGIESPIYIDLRLIVSYPELLEQVAELFISIASKNISCKNICGVPYTALPIATCMSIKTKLPMLMRRKEEKKYGTKKLVEGVFNEGDTCLVIEDLVTSGSSTLETVEVLRSVGLKVTDAIVLLEREQGGRENLQKNGVKLHSACTMTQLLTILESKIDQAIMQSIDNFLQNNRLLSATTTSKRRSFEQRAASCSNVMTKRLFQLMETKKTNIAVAIDVTKCDKLIELANQIGPYVCMVKIHVDILEDFDTNFITKLKSMAEKHNFLIMEDRKFADIGHTVKTQFDGGIYHIADWADFVTAHALPGPGLLDGLEEIGLSKNCSCFLIAQMSSKGSLANEEYSQTTASMAMGERKFVSGFISQSRLSDNDTFIYATPGVNLGSEGDCLGQKYITPDEAIMKRGADLIIVGRGITNAPDVTAAAALYKQTAWKAYQLLITHN